jgi:hypothetical protein
MEAPELIFRNYSGLREFGPETLVVLMGSRSAEEVIVGCFFARLRSDEQRVDNAIP